jgi:hypothetical protein
VSEKCTVENYIFVLPYGSKIIECYYKEENNRHETADKYMGRSAKDAKTAFEAIKAFKPISLPENLKQYCGVTRKPCDPNSWFCHRQFIAIRFFDDRPGYTTKGCYLMRTRGADWIEALRERTNSTTGICFAKLTEDTNMVANIKGCSTQHAYANYAQAFFDS